MFGVKKSKFANRLKRALPKFRSDRSQVRPSSVRRPSVVQEIFFEDPLRRRTSTYVDVRRRFRFCFRALSFTVGELMGINADIKDRNSIEGPQGGTPPPPTRWQGF